MPLHPQSKMFVEMMKAQSRPPWQELPVEESRELFAGFQTAYGEGPKLHSVEDRSMAGVPVRIYRPKDTVANSPCIVYFHGGGWVIGDLDTHDTLCRRLAEAADCCLVSVDYRLAPENKYPAAFDDCYSVTSFVSEHAGELGVDAARLIVAGDSAGGNLAAGVTLKARDVRGPSIRLQVLIYPVIEPKFDTVSYREFAVDHGLTAATMEWMWSQYYDATAAGDRHYVVVTENELRGLPSTHVVTAEYDILRDEGQSFADQLSKAGVEVTQKQYDGMLHGFIHFSALFRDGLAAISDIASVIEASNAG